MQLLGNLGAFWGLSRRKVWKWLWGITPPVRNLPHLQNFSLRGRQYNVFLSENRHGDAFCMASHKNTRFSFETKDILGANSRKKVAYLINRLQNLINRFNKRPFIKKYWGKKRKKNYERGVSNLASRSKIPPPDALERRPRRQKLF